MCNTSFKWSTLGHTYCRLCNRYTYINTLNSNIIKVICMCYLIAGHNVMFDKHTYKVNLNAKMRY